MAVSISILFATSKIFLKPCILRLWQWLSKDWIG